MGSSITRREALYREFLEGAAFIDVEVQSRERLSELCEMARARGVRVIVSQHFFKRTPPAWSLQRTLPRVGGAADVLKVAGYTAKPADVAALLSLFGERLAPHLSVMGMGPLGKASRLLFARAGSCLNYGYLGEPQVSGQWPAVLLKERLREVLAEA